MKALPIDIVYDIDSVIKVLTRINQIINTYPVNHFIGFCDLVSTYGSNYEKRMIKHLFSILDGYFYPEFKYMGHLFRPYNWKDREEWLQIQIAKLKDLRSNGYLEIRAYYTNQKRP